MVDHTFSDDVAITRAWTKQGAIKKFRLFYTEVDPWNVLRIKPRKCSDKVQILTDY